MPKKKTTTISDSEFIKSIPEPCIEYLKKNLDKSNDILLSYVIGFSHGMKYG
jgi:hypothetical protein